MTGTGPLFHAATRAWFAGAFPAGPTPAQEAAWPRIAAGDGVLLVSPTGTGKTLAAFLVALDGILARRLAGDDEPGPSVVYVSPLKALDNDVRRNLEVPRLGIRREAGALGFDPARAEIRTAVRTGDTLPPERRSQLRTPPDVLITTPESLYILLTGAGRDLLSRVRTVILDEVHSVAGSKRGAHLALTLERLEALLASRGRPSPQRIALSATVSPVDAVAAFAAGSGPPLVPVVVLERGRKEADLTVTSPAPDFRDLPDGSSWGPAVEAIVREAGGKRTTLVFCNNRRLAEKVAAKLSLALERDVPAHHGSISRPVRERLEADLKAGRLPVLVATGSLELGLDVGPIDSVVQVESPKGIARALQRVGRSGHLVGERSRGLLVPLYEDDLFECAATVEGMRAGAGAIEETRPPEFPLDVLAQQLVAECVARGTDSPATATELWDLVRGAASYRRLPRSLFHETLAMLSGKYAGERFASLSPKLVWDRATDRVTPLPGARIAALLDGGTIADRGTFRAVLRDGKTAVGELDEEFVFETREGDVFLLGSRAWRAVEISPSRVVVEEASGEPARMPFWRGEGLGRSGALGERVGALKRGIAERLDDPGLPSFLAARCGATPEAAAAMAGAVRREVRESGGLATERCVVFESFPNDLGDPCVVVRSLFGRGVNLPWSLVLASVLRDETGVDVEAVASDDGILLRLPRAEREVPLERLSRVTAAEARERLLAHLPDSPMFGARFRENAQRALLLPRNRGGRRTPFWLQRLRARDLLQSTRSLPDFPIVAETYRDCLKDLWETDRLLALLSGLEGGEVERLLVSRRFPSPAAASLLFKFVAVYMYEWDAPKAERQIHALAANRALLGEILGERLDEGLRPEAAIEAAAEATRTAPRRAVRDAEELLSALQELGDLSDAEIGARSTSAPRGAAWIAELSARGSAVRAAVGGEERWIAAEERERGRYASLEGGTLDLAGIEALLLRFAGAHGPATAAEAGRRFGLAEPVVEEALERLRLEGLVVRGPLGDPAGAVRWATARLAETIRRKTVAILRREIRPVPAAVFRAFLARRQGAAPGSRFAGEGASERAAALLRSLPLPVLAWESAILPARLAAPDPGALDALSTRGLFAWRLRGERDARLARLALVFRGEGRLSLPHLPPDVSALSPEARSLLEALAISGASFLPDLARTCGLAPAPLEAALRELALAGLVTGDGMHGLRELLRGPRRLARREAGTGLPATPLGSRPPRGALREAGRRVARGAALPSGRWSLLDAPGVNGPDLAPGEREESWARLLLARWGVVSRGVVEREEFVRWSEVAPVLGRMEMRGDVRRGEFVEGEGPIQYAGEEAVEELRETRTRPGADLPLVPLGGSDPVLASLEKPAAPGEWVVLAGGDPFVRLSAAGALRVRVVDPSLFSDRAFTAALAALQELVSRSRDPLSRPRRLLVSSLESGETGEAPATLRSVAPLLEGLGFTRSGTGWGWRAL